LIHSDRAEDLLGSKVLSISIECFFVDSPTKHQICLIKPVDIEIILPICTVMERRKLFQLLLGAKGYIENQQRTAGTKTTYMRLLYISE
jgi:hypothetical protein